jgi:hypothetical protein
MTIEDIKNIKTIEIFLDKTGFARKEIDRLEQEAISGFITKLLVEKNIKDYWIVKDGDNYKYLIDEFATSEKISMGKMFAGYVYKVWGFPTISLLAVISLDGMGCINDTLLYILTDLIFKFTNKHRAIVAKLHKIKVEKNIAISKIKRNVLYNNGLGLKLAIRGYSKDFTNLST